ncbi:endolytic transglycosylase MltG [Candidatus Cardinium hertigii]|uniref:Endolytic murein transglycosylase n=1 Tax=Candidatus Cardinium hertigii TaxID=247481 RepID=A0A3N2QCI6_9BACT|nr:endolytic transglycosylase MltG [Candidatus Cardinium hertigii]ROT47516.1 endolytic transglycosylase MltG [Candidatus Cardinium hertigii]
MAGHALDYISSRIFFKSTQKKGCWLLIFSFLVCSTWYGICYRANILLGQPDRLLIIPRACTLDQLTTQLKKAGYIKNATTFLWTAYILRYKPQYAPGQYQLISNMNNWQLVKMLRGAMQYPVKITFSTATNKEDLVAQLVKRIGIPQEELLHLLNDAKQLLNYGFSAENILTMFIPDSYEVYWTITAEQLLYKIYSNYKRFWNATRLEKAAKMQLSPISVSILASIVQSETNDQQEAAIIAGVYVNRLKRKMPLQSCPVLIYALKEKGIVAKRVLKNDTYIYINQYRKKELPSGPIALPSVHMIDAVLNYIQHDYLFFSAKEDFSGLHYFTNNYKTHVNNANKYRRVLNALKIMR